MRIEDLLRLVPDEALQAVDDTYRRYGQIIRTVVRDETRLRLQPPGGTPTGSVDDGLIPVHIEHGYPESLESLKLDPESALASHLSLFVPTIQSFRAAGQSMAEILSGLGGNLAKLPDAKALEDVPGQAVTLADVLLALVKKHDLVKSILNVKDDVLGVYRIGRHSWSRQPLIGGGRPSIVLFRGIIALTAQCLGVGVPALTVVVLAHELAHAFTHAGYDGNGERGQTDWFCGLELDACEGLAQYYAERAVTRMDGRVPGTKAAYEELLKHQPEPYLKHASWIKDASPEAVRSALLIVRRRELKKYAELNALITEAQQGMSKPTKQKRGLTS